MGIKDLFNNKTEEKKVVEEKTTVDLNELVNRVRSVGDIGSSKLNSATYYSCMNIRCNAVAKLPLKLYREKEQGSEKATNHYLYSLLKSRPNKFMTTHDFLFLTEFYRLDRGNAFWYISTKNGKVDGLYILNPDLITVFIDDVGIVGDKMNVYYIYRNSSEEIIYDADEICHFKNFAVKNNGLEGTSIKKYLYDTIEREQRAAKVISEKYKTGLINPLIVEYAGDLNEAKQQSIIAKFAKMGGAKNAGKVVPIPTDFRVNQLETKLSDNQFFEMQGLTTRQIANAFGIKGFQLNDMEKSTYNNIEQQNRAFYSDTLQNVLTIYEQEMDYKIISKKEQNELFWKFNVDSVVRSDLATRYEAYTKAIASGYMTIAEVRDKEDLPFIEGTDKLIIGNGASIPLSDLGKQYSGGGEK
ncbi:phage portal protein [Clostridium massiliamazoniense]|uniref:phage portal protein n=1 Tax=Clostridium massiliamazoniense TaxID=1347366 RepID=UPI000B1BDE64|nr:phage portal protein [Clostridium massiliamazoniense]